MRHGLRPQRGMNRIVTTPAGVDSGTWTEVPVSAPPNFLPVDAGPVAAILPGFLDRRRRIKEALQAARGFAIDRIKIAAPFDGRVLQHLVQLLCDSLG
jgi:hypothetical protein